MRVITKGTLRNFWTEHHDAEEALKAWHAEVENAAWKNPAEVKAKYGSASILRNSRVVFNICGNKYRLMVKFNYACDRHKGVAYIRFIGPHKAYDKIDAETI